MSRDIGIPKKYPAADLPENDPLGKIFASDVNTLVQEVQKSALSGVALTAKTSLSSGRLVYVAGNQVTYFDPMDPSLYGASLGITTTSAVISAQVMVQFTGIFQEPGLGLIPGKEYFAGLNGTFTLNPTGLKLVQSVGRAVNQDSININIQSPIIII